MICHRSQEEETASFTCSVVSDSLPPTGLETTKLLCPWDFLDKNTEVGCHSLLQGTFLMQGLNPGLQEGELKCFMHVQLLSWTCMHLVHHGSLLCPFMRWPDKCD